MFSPAKALGGLLDYATEIQTHDVSDLLRAYEITDLMLTCAQFALFLIVVINVCARPFNRLYAQVPGGKKYRFPAVNIVSVCIGLLPALYILAEGVRALKMNGFHDALLSCFVADVTAFALGAGMCIGDIHNAFPPENPPKTPGEHATWILMGALGGLMMLYLSLLAFNILVIVVVLMCTEPLISGVVALCTLVAMVHSIMKRKRRPANSAAHEKMNLEKEMAVILANVKKSASPNSQPAPKANTAPGASVESNPPPPQTPGNQP